MAGKRTTYVVEGAGQFPVDMLRHDESWPHGQDDSVKLASQDPELRRQVKLATDFRPNLRRWVTFGWKVVKIDGSPVEEWM